MWEELYEAYYKELTAYAAGMSGSREQAEDLVQETFVRALMHEDTVEELSTGQRRAWLYRTMKNLYFDRCRRNVLEHQYLSTLPGDGQEDPGIQSVEQAMVLEQLRPEDRTIFTLWYLAGYAPGEIAVLFNLPPGTVRSKLSRCRRALQETLKI